MLITPWEGKHSVLCMLVLAENLAAGCTGMPVVVRIKLSLPVYEVSRNYTRDILRLYPGEGTTFHSYQNYYISSRVDLLSDREDRLLFDQRSHFDPVSGR
jgi:hypothetical protein